MSKEPDAATEARYPEPLDHGADASYDAEFFFDPVCPWAWITSRWVTEVVAVRGISVHWNFISLKVLNEGKTLEPDYAARAAISHGRGLRLLRVAAAVRAEHGAGAVPGVYTAFGNTIHPDQMAEVYDGNNKAIAFALKELRHDPAISEQADNDAWDAEIRSSTALALSRTGNDVGTPIITYAPPDGPSLFGPVLSAAPRGEEAGELWDHVAYIARNPDFAELKRAIRNKPRF
jgi:hypothetical protein